MQTYIAQATLINSILSNSTGSGGTDLFVNAPENVVGNRLNLVASNADASSPNVVVSAATSGGGNLIGPPITTDPGLAPVLASNGGLTATHAIGPSSSAFNAGATSLDTDQRGVTRPQGGIDDIGAFEFQVVATPSLATNSSPNIALGGQAHDTATLAAGSSPTGQITFRLYGPGDANCSGPAVFTDTKPVNGNGNYLSASFTPAQPGTYRWIASYSGDGGNNPVSGSCNDSNESFTVAPGQEPTPPSDDSPPPSDDPTPLLPDTPPTLTLDYDSTQALGRSLPLSASCDEPCSVVAQAKLKTVVERSGNRIRADYTVRRDGIKLNSAGQIASLELTLTEKAQKKARQALDSGGSAKVKGVVTATDDAFNVTKQRFEIELS